MLKSIVLSAALLLLNVGVAAAQAQPTGMDPAAKVVRDNDAQRPVDPQRPVNVDKLPPQASDVPYRGPDAPGDCANCPPPRHYDSTEVIKNSRDVDHSRVINTSSEVIVPPKVREINKLVIHENETRNIGTIEHNHQIIEKEIRYVKRAPVPRYAPVRRVKRVEMVLVAVPQARPCSCGCGACGQTSYTYAYTYVPVQKHTYAPVQQYAVRQQYVVQQPAYAPVQQYAVVPVPQPRAYSDQTAPAGTYYTYR